MTKNRSCQFIPRLFVVLLASTLAIATAAPAQQTQPPSPPAPNQEKDKKVEPEKKPNAPTENPPAVVNPTKLNDQGTDCAAYDPAAQTLPDDSAKPSARPKITLCAIVVDPRPEDIAKVSLSRFVIFKADRSFTAIQKSETVNNKFGLYINDMFMKGLEPVVVPGHSNWVKFRLILNADNRDAWSVIFQRKGCTTGKNDASKLSLTAGMQDGSWAAAEPQALYLEYLPDWWSWILLLISVIIAIATVLLGKLTTMLRDSGTPRHDGKEGTYSLGRFQMALWFVTIVFAFLFTFAITGDMLPIPQGALVLMGIGAGTALGAAAIDVTNKASSRADSDKLTKQETDLTAQVANLQTKMTALPANDPGLPPLQIQISTLQQQLTSAKTQIAQLPSNQVGATEGFIRDMLSDENGISFHRLQVFAWTFVFWGIFVSSLFQKITLVNFDATQLALMGISGTTYLGFKLQEKQSGT